MCSEIQQVGSCSGYYDGAVDGNCRPCYGARTVRVDLEPMELLVARLLTESQPRIPLGARSWSVSPVTSRVFLGKATLPLVAKGKATLPLVANAEFKGRVIRETSSKRI